MGSIRQLKKDINKLAFSLLSECFAIKHYHDESGENEFDKIIKKIVYLRNDLIVRANHPELNAETDSIKEHYRSVQSDLVDLIDVVEKYKKAIV
ncbi:MAG TPA: hypothetical protein ENN61_05330 [Bacteroidaceae bacterium]|nr:hypothetical protein [Bacteroidaceae bacterium]